MYLPKHLFYNLIQVDMYDDENGNYRFYLYSAQFSQRIRDCQKAMDRLKNAINQQPKRCEAYYLRCYFYMENFIEWRNSIKNFLFRTHNTPKQEVKEYLEPMRADLMRGLMRTKQSNYKIKAIFCRIVADLIDGEIKISLFPKVFNRTKYSKYKNTEMAMRKMQKFYFACKSICKNKGRKPLKDLELKDFYNAMMLRETTSCLLFPIVNIMIADVKKTAICLLKYACRKHNFIEDKSLLTLLKIANRDNFKNKKTEMLLKKHELNICKSKIMQDHYSRIFNIIIQDANKPIANEFILKCLLNEFVEYVAKSYSEDKDSKFLANLSQQLKLSPKQEERITEDLKYLRNPRHKNWRNIMLNMTNIKTEEPKVRPDLVVRVRH